MVKSHSRRVLTEVAWHKGYTLLTKSDVLRGRENERDTVTHFPSAGFFVWSVARRRSASLSVRSAWYVNLPTAHDCDWANGALGSF